MANGASDGRPFFLLALHRAALALGDARRQALAQDVKDNLFHLHGGNIHTYRRMIHHMDEGIGWVMAAQTNGWSTTRWWSSPATTAASVFSDNWPLVGGKMDLTEGGIRVPWIAHWPAVIAPGGTSAQACMTMDWSATMLDAAGVAPTRLPLDGVSLLPVLRDGQEFDRPLHWRMNHRGQRALRDGDWKYLRVDGHDYLFNLPADERERANLGGREPATAGRDARGLGDLERHHAADPH